VKKIIPLQCTPTPTLRCLSVYLRDSINCQAWDHKYKDSNIHSECLNGTIDIPYSDRGPFSTYGLCADSRPSVSYKSKTRNHQLRMQFIVELQSQYSSYCDTIGLYWIVPVFGITPVRGRCSMAMVSGRSIVNSTCCYRISFLSNASIPSHSIILHIPIEQHRFRQCTD